MRKPSTKKNRSWLYVLGSIECLSGVKTERDDYREDQLEVRVS